MYPATWLGTGLGAPHHLAGDQMDSGRSPKCFHELVTVSQGFGAVSDLVFWAGCSVCCGSFFSLSVRLSHGVRHLLSLQQMRLYSPQPLPSLTGAELPVFSRLFLSRWRIVCWDLRSTRFAVNVAILCSTSFSSHTAGKILMLPLCRKFGVPAGVYRLSE